MKHLQKYKLFESNINNDIKDLLVELEDLNFYIANKNTTIDTFNIKKINSDTFSILEVKDFILRAIDALGDKVYLFLLSNGLNYRLSNETNSRYIYYNRNGDTIKTTWNLLPIQNLLILIR